MREELVERFEERFGGKPAALARAPGRVNLIGEHTDYNEGLVLPFAIDRATWVAIAPREGGRMRVLATDLGEESEIDPARLARTGTWIDYPQGIVHALDAAGLAPDGCDLAIASDLPRESGVSSSAALGVALASAFDAAFDLGLDARGRAEVAHRAETAFVGVRCGIMDPFASALGRRDHALRIDCRDLGVEPVPLPSAAGRVLLVDSGVRRRLASGGYGDRRTECETALRAAREAGVAPANATALRDLTQAELPRLEAALPPVLARRARHVVRENARVDAVCRALAAGDLEGVGGLLREGMASLRDDFEVSVPELDHLCERADAHPGVLGSRLTGAGFGGCTLHLVGCDAAADAGAWIADGFEAEFGRRPAVLEVTAAQGARAVRMQAA